MVETRVDAATFWTERMALLTAEDRADIKRIIAEAEPRRKLAKFNTGSITETAALALRALSRWVRPKSVVEVGTFIGVSTLSFDTPTVYTCDASNDCLPTGLYGCTIVHAWPYRTSTDMLSGWKSGVFEFFFFDGLISSSDAQMVKDMAATGAVFVFDDYNGQFKGVQNVAKLQPLLSHHVLIPAAGPVKDDTTLAVLVPESRL